MVVIINLLEKFLRASSYRHIADSNPYTLFHLRLERTPNRLGRGHQHSNYQLHDIITKISIIINFTKNQSPWPKPLSIWPNKEQKVLVTDVKYLNFLWSLS